MQIASKHDLYDIVYVLMHVKILKTRILGSILDLDGKQYYIVKYEGDFYEIKEEEIFENLVDILRYLRNNILEDFDI